jgi:hypothetical protein
MICGGLFHLNEEAGLKPPGTFASANFATLALAARLPCRKITRAA